MPHTNEDARYDLETLRKVRHEVAESAAAIALMAALTDEVEYQLQNLHPLYPHKDHFTEVRRAVAELQRTLNAQRNLGAEIHNFTYLGNLAVYRDLAELGSDTPPPEPTE